MSLNLGKVNAEVLKEHILRHLPVSPKLSLDSSLLTLSGEMVVSYNPALGTPLETLVSSLFII